MDPRLLLGVGARAGRSEVRAAHRRLRRALDPARGGTVEICRLLDVASSAAIGNRPADLRVDPYAVLGLQPGLGGDEVRAAYRRLARLVHPDLGGTDELFRVVEAAHAAVTNPSPDAAASRRRHGAPRRGPTASDWWPHPPSPPPPRGPFRAPAPDDRRASAPWRAWRDLAQHVAVLLTVALAAVGAIYAGRALAALYVVVTILLTGPVLQPALDGIRRATVVLLGARVRVAPEVEPERFLEETCLDAPVGRQREHELYRAYERWCVARGQPVAPWVFVERLRALGLLYVRSSAWDSGLWVGITLRR